MKHVIVIFASLLVFCAAQAQDDVQLVQFTNDNNVDGSYQFAYEQSDGQKREEKGELKPVAGAEEPALSVTGSYEYTDPNGQRYRVEYVADEKGYRPTVTKL
ncbi:endocuticle structural glycoprotein ABD-5-like [Anopheles marshallii]|uniref:endocuticle structural glycoprotein ABD-5-like n=1 Tax=Anopheles marshallii TaxID=1521116 RepID=UPI00237BD039|nr:endocuticle structural glycoprotein ABD-5-like [Anopheles marshallii]